MKAGKRAVLHCPDLWGCSEKNLELNGSIKGDNVLVCVTRGERKCVSLLQTTPKEVTAKGQTSLLAQEYSIGSKIPLQHREKWEVWSIQYRSGGICSWVTRWSNGAMPHCCICAPLTNKYSSANAKPKSLHQESPDKECVTFWTKKLCYSKCSNIVASSLL